MTAKMGAGLDAYVGFGDPDAEHVLTKDDAGRQREAERLREALRRDHFHQFTVGRQEGSYFSHSHEGWDEPAHVHPGTQAFPLSEGGGYWEESGPSLGSAPPAPVAANIARVRQMLLDMPPTPPHMLMRWRLRLYCGHVVERKAHRDHHTVERAFSLGRACPECGLDPAIIVAGPPLGPAGELPKVSAPPTKNLEALRRRLAKAEAEVARLKVDIAGVSAMPSGGEE